MRLAGLTWWRNNYGSILQAYALQNELNSYPEIDYQIINQFGKKITSVDNLCNKLKTVGINKTCQRIFWKFVVPKLRKRNSKFQRFVDERLFLSERQYNEDTISEANSIYDGFVCGSDQIWNPTLTKLSSMYWLNFADGDKKKIAYAPSIGVDSLSINDGIIIRKNLEDFTAISCRENTGTKLINSVLGENRCQTVLDPTMVVNIQVWDSICAENRIKEPYVFVYLLRGSKQQRRLIEQFAQEKNLKVVTMPFLETEHIVLYDFKFGDIKFWDASPEEFIGVIKNAEYVFTDSFHSMVFSCLYHVPFMIFPKQGKAQMSRIQGLMCLLEIEPRIVGTYTDMNNLYLKRIDWNKSDKIISREKAKSKEYLKRAIKVL